MESFAGSLETVYWDVESAAAYALADLPDSVTAKAVLTAMTKTGAFVSLYAHELLTEEQLSEVLVLAGDDANIYKVPGYPVGSVSANG
jgi:hypothetical protein